MYHLDDTIAAIASAPGGGARGIVRLSGPRVVEVLERCFQPAGSDSLGNGFARVIAGTLRLACSPLDGLPCDLYLWPDARSYTRQPAGELHTFGSAPLLAAALGSVCAAGARLAEPGEFTLRAFLAGRLDLTQAEAVLGVIDAAGRRQFDTALAQLAGGLARPLHALRDRLLDLLAHLEAGLDFAEEDLQFISAAELERELGHAIDVVERLAVQMSSRARAAESVRVVLFGWPNTGKSSLFNALAAGGRALVSATPGTTRDYLTARLDFGGLDCQLVDTAGVELGQPVEGVRQAAQQAASEQAGQADLRVLCIDSTRPMNAWERRELAEPSTGEVLVVLTKCDAPLNTDFSGVAIETSAFEGLGLDRLTQKLREAFLAVQDPQSVVVASTAVRCQDSLRHSAQALARAYDINARQGGEELIAAEVRGALDELGKVVGAVYSDDILDRIFSRFCIGK